MATSKIDIWNMALDYCGESQKVESAEDDSETAAACARHWDKVLRELLEARPWPWATRTRALVELDDIVTTVAYADAVSPFNTFSIPGAYLESDQVAVVKIAAGGARTTLTTVTDYTLATDTITLVVALVAGQSIEITVSYSRSGWQHLYSLPSDCVTPRVILSGDSRLGLVLTPDFRLGLVASASLVPYAIMVNDGGDARILACDFASTDMDALEYTALIDNPSVFSAHFIEALACRMAVALSLALRKDPKVGAYWRQQADLALRRAAGVERESGHELPPDSSSVVVRG